MIANESYTVIGNNQNKYRDDIMMRIWKNEDLKLAKTFKENIHQLRLVQMKMISL